MSERQKWIDMIKGFAIISVVIGHACERVFFSGWADNLQIIHYVDILLNSYHMPLFFMASGYVYRMTEERKNSTFKEFVKKKALDLLLPYSWFAVAVWIGKFVFSKFVLKKVSVLDLLIMYVNPVAFLWFIYVLFFISVFIWIMEKVFKDKPFIIVPILVLMAIAYMFFKTDNRLIERFLYYPIFYYVGVLIYRNREKLTSKYIYIVIISGIVWVGLFILYYNYSVDLLKIIVGMSGAVFFFTLFYSIFKNMSKSNFISTAGVNSMYIYIMHPIIMNAVKMLFSIAGLKYVYLCFIVLILTGVLIPMVYAYMAGKLHILEFPFRPRKYLIKKSASAKTKKE